MNAHPLNIHPAPLRCAAVAFAALAAGCAYMPFAGDNAEGRGTPTAATAAAAPADRVAAPAPADRAGPVTTGKCSPRDD